MTLKRDEYPAGDPARMQDALEQLKTDREINEFIRQNCTDAPSLSSMINSWLADGRTTIAELMRRSRINRNYGYNIINGKRVNPSRDKVLALCIAACLSVGETQETLAAAKAGELYFRSERDVRIAGALNNKVGDVLKVNIMLAEHGLEPLE